MTPCPVCGKPVDTLRAPAARVRDGKIVGYCSKECAAAAETKPTPKLETVAPAGKRTPAKGVPTGKRTPAGGVVVPASARDLDSGPVIEILHEPASGVVTSAADARSSAGSASSSRVEADGAIQIADTGYIDDYVDVEPRRKTGLIVLVLLLVVVGGGFAAYQLGYFDDLLHPRSSPAVTPTAVVKEPVVEIDAAPAITAEVALDRARSLLRAQLRSDSPRVQRVAASALARTGDPEALAQLGTMLGKETGDIARLDIAYALARGGDKRGGEALGQALAAPRRDVKAEAARRLVLLGDKRGIPTLAEFLEISQHRLSAAEQLALIAEPHAIDALQKIVADDKATPDDRARASIALGFAGKAEVAPALRALLDDARFNAFAAAALAALHDAAARPILVKQLDIPSLRIGAARALRRLEPGLDATPLLPALIAALGSAKDTEQVQAAEAILLIAGPAGWSERE